MNLQTNPKALLLLVVLVLTSLSSYSQDAAVKETAAARDARMAWWRDATFGMFIHWGVYAIPAGEYQGKAVEGIGEWIMEKGKIPIPEYEAFARQFNPTAFNANEWVRVAKEAGVKYIVITTKHHDGFALWDSKVSTYDIMDFSPYKRDIIGELTKATKAAGIKMCFYYSILDWHHPDAKSVKYPHQQNSNPDWNNYRENYMKPQLVELIKNYDPAVLWFDGEWIDEWTEEQGQELYRFLRDLKPDLIINNRVGKGRKGMNGMNAYEDAAGDFGTPEQEILEGTSDYDWESCMTMNDTWGFKKNDHNWKSSETLIHNLADIAAKGGNYLLNIGPKADGTIPQESVDRLKAMGKWLRTNGEAIYATTSFKEYKEDDVRFTGSKDGKYKYAIVLNATGKQVTLSNLNIKPGSKLHILGYKKPLKWTTEEAVTRIEIPADLKYEHAFTIKIPN